MDSEIDNYEILNQLATGGQGVTSRVRRKADNSLLVLKECFCDSSKAGNSALQEAKVLQSLKHPYVIRYEDVFLSEKAGQLVVCTVMEYCDGGDLARYFIALKKHNVPIPPKRVVGWARQLAAAVAYLHQNNVLHRDLKPQNVFMATEDSLRIGDFGLAQTMERGKRTSQVGTPCYMAPEVLQNDAYADSVDVWGVGCIVLEAITLEFLWERKGMLAAHVLSEPVMPRKLPSEYPAFLREATAASLAATPQRRPAANVLVQMLQGGQEGNADAMAGLGQLFENFQTSASEALSNLFNPQQQLQGGEYAYAPPAEPHERAILSTTGRSITASVAQSHAPPSQAAGLLPPGAKAAPALARSDAGGASKLQALPESSAALLGAPSASSFRTTQAPSVAAPASTFSAHTLPASLPASALNSPPPQPPASHTPAANRPHSAAQRPTLPPSPLSMQLPGAHKGLPAAAQMLSMPVGGGGARGSAQGGSGPSGVALLSQLTARKAQEELAAGAQRSPEAARPQHPASSPPAPRSAAPRQGGTGAGEAGGEEEAGEGGSSAGGEGRGGERSPKGGGGRGKGLTGGGSFKGAVREGGEEASAGPRPEGGDIPAEVLETYLEGGLFAVEPQWRGVVQRAVQRRQLEGVQQQAAEAKEGGKKAGGGGGRKGEGGGGVWSALSKSFSFGSKGKGAAGPSAPPVEERGDGLSGRKWGKKVLVEKANKQYELLYGVAEWEQAREATARVTAVDASGNFQKEYAEDAAVEAEYKRRFGPPKSRFIGSSEKLMVV